MYKGYIYRHWHVNEDDVEKNYIGQVYNRTPQQRWGKNGRGYLQKRKDGKYSYFARAIRKYGWNNFQHKVLLVIECETLEELVFWLDQWETYYIEKYDSFYNGYNGTNGGKNGYIVSDETKNRQSDSMKSFYETDGGMKRREQQREQVSGENNPFYGQNHTDEVIATLSELAKQRTGAKSQRGKKVICLNTKQIFDTAKQASEWCHGNVKNHCQGRTSCSGTHPTTGEHLAWAYYTDYIKMTEEEINNRILQAKEFSFKDDKNPRATKVICLETKQVFITIKEAEQWCCGNLNQHLTGKSKTCGKHPITGEKLHWMRYDKYLKLQNELNELN